MATIDPFIVCPLSKLLTDEEAIIVESNCIMIVKYVVVAATI